MKTKKILALLLAVLTLGMLLAGCTGNGTNGGNDANNTNGGNGGGNADPTQLASRYAYKVDYYPVQVEGMNYVNNICLVGDRLFLTGDGVIGTVTETDIETGEEFTYDEWGTVLATCDIDGKNVRTLDYTPVKENSNWGGSYIQAMAGTRDAFFLVENSYETIFNLPDDFNEEYDNYWDFYDHDENRYYLHKYDASGVEVGTVELAVGEENTYLSYMVIDSAGNLYTTDWANIYVFNADGAIVKTISLDDIGNFNGLSKLDENTVGITTYGSGGGYGIAINDDVATLAEPEVGGSDTGMSFIPIDPATGAFGDPIPLVNNAWNIMPGFGEYLYTYYYNGKLFGYNEETEESEKILDWMDYDVNSDNIMGNINLLPDGRILAISTEWTNDSSSNEIVILTQVDASTLPQKEQITLACMYLDWNLRNQIINFNKRNDTYRIVVQDYSEYATEEDYMAGLTKLNTEIISGRVPDMLYTANLPIASYGARGLLEDLWPWIDDDPEISREDLMTNVLEAMESDGKLYYLTSTFSIRTAIGRTNVVGDTPGWTLSELQAALNTLQPGATVFTDTMTKSNMFYNLLSMNVNRFIDWETGSCSFDSQEFIDLLKFAAGFADDTVWDDYDWDNYESDYVRMMQGKQLLYQVYLSDFYSLASPSYGLGLGMTAIGYPTDSGNGAAFQVNDGIAVSSRCAHKDVVWSFVRQTLLPSDNNDYYYYGFSINRETFEKAAQTAMTVQYDDDGNKISSYGYWDEEKQEYVEMDAMPQEIYDKLMELYEGTHTVVTYNQEIFDLINDEAATFFAGQRSAEETARMLQSRVGLYIAEQM